MLKVKWTKNMLNFYFPTKKIISSVVIIVARRVYEHDNKRIRDFLVNRLFFTLV